MWKCSTSNSSAWRRTSSISSICGRDPVADARVQTQRARPDGFQLGLGDGVAGREQRHVMAEIDQRLGDLGHDALGAAVEFRRHGFGQRGDLRNPHILSP